MSKFGALTSDPRRFIPPPPPRPEPTAEDKAKMAEGRTAMKKVGEMPMTRRRPKVQGDRSKTGAPTSVASSPDRTTLLGGGY